MSAPCPILGFSVRAMVRETASDGDVDALYDSLIDLLEAHGLSAGGGGDRTLEWSVSRDGSQATDADRQLVLGWATRWSHTATIAVSDLIDLNADA